MTLLARLAALERRQPAGWIVIGECCDGGPITYTLCPRFPGEAARRLSAEAFEVFAVTHPIAVLRIYER